MTNDLIPKPLETPSFHRNTNQTIITIWLRIN